MYLMIVPKYDPDNNLYTACIGLNERTITICYAPTAEADTKVWLETTYPYRAEYGRIRKGRREREFWYFAINENLSFALTLLNGCLMSSTLENEKCFFLTDSIIFLVYTEQEIKVARCHKAKQD